LKKAQIFGTNKTRGMNDVCLIISSRCYRFN
jgi:hypothetical protein